MTGPGPLGYWLLGCWMIPYVIDKRQNHFFARILTLGNAGEFEADPGNPIYIIAEHVPVATTSRIRMTSSEVAKWRPERSATSLATMEIEGLDVIGEDNRESGTESESESPHGPGDIAEKVFRRLALVSRAVVVLVLAVSAATTAGLAFNILSDNEEEDFSAAVSLLVVRASCVFWKRTANGL